MIAVNSDTINTGGYGGSSHTPYLSASWWLGWILLPVNILLTLLVARLYYDALLNAPVNVDAGYFLPLALRISEGLVPVRDIAIGYTPFLIFIFSGLAKLVGEGNSAYPVFLGTVFLFHFGCAVLIYKLGNFITPQRSLRYLSAVLAMLSLYVHEGDYVFLETPVSFFALLGAWMLLSRPREPLFLFLSGICAYLSFFSKQYGAMTLVGYAIFYLMSPEKFGMRAKWVGCIVAGFFLPLIATLLLSIWIFQIPLQGIVVSALHPGYFKKIADLSNLREFTLHTSLFLMLIPLLFFQRDVRRNQCFHLIGILLVLFSFSLLVRPFLHYLGLVIPYVILLSLFLCESARKISPVLCLAFLFFYTPLVFKAYEYPPWSESTMARTRQVEIAQRIHEVWSPGTKVMVFGEPSLFYTCNFYPIDNLYPGYSFLVNFTPTQLVGMLGTAEHVLVDRTSESFFLGEKKRIEEEYGDFNSLLIEQKFQLKTVLDGHLEFWEKASSLH